MRSFAVIAVVLFLSSSYPARADDLDLLLSGGGIPPNVMLLLPANKVLTKEGFGGCKVGIDAGCNDSKADILAAALDSLVRNINPPDGMGGYIERARFGVAKGGQNAGGELVVPISANNMAAVLAAVNDTAALFGNSANSDGTQTTDLLRYLAGPASVASLPAFGDTGLDAGWGAQPAPIDGACRPTFVIFVVDGKFKSNNNFGESRYGSCGGTPCFNVDIGDYDGDGSAWADDVAQYAFENDLRNDLDGLQNIVTHVIGYDYNDPDYPAIATQSGGLYQLADNSTALNDALAQAMIWVFESLVHFATANVPSTQTAFGNGFYVASFEPSSGNYFWPGHLKAFRLGANRQLLDKNGNSITDPNGLILDTAVPFWDAGEELADANHPARSLYRTKGGSRIAFEYGSGATKVTTGDLDVLASELTLYPNNPTISFATINDLAEGILDFVVGKDTFDEDGDTDVTEKRDAVLGDIFHSGVIAVGPPPPALLLEDGYGPADDPASFVGLYKHRDRKLYVGANDGMLHAFNGGSFNSGDDGSTTEVENGYYDAGTGQEEFGYVPGLLLDTLKYIPRNVPRQHYYADASPSVADVWIPSFAGDTSKDPAEWATVLVTGMRQGGSGYLALDVTDPSDTAYPELLWELDETVLPLGQTWSEPVITRVRLKAGTSDLCGKDTTDDGPCIEKWVAIFAGGYRIDGDPNLGFYLDPNDPSWSANSKGFFMVAIDTGTVIGKVVFDPTPTAELNKMRYSMPSTPAVLDLDADGFADVAYIGDLGGQVWRWDISGVGEDTVGSDGIMDNWYTGLFFEPPSVTLSGGAKHYHSIYNPPVATYLNKKLVLAFASGERSDPDYRGDPSVDDNNRIWVIWDEEPLGIDPSDPNSNWVTIPEPQTTINGQLRGLTDVTNATLDTDLNDDGYFIRVDEGEKFITNHIIFAGLFVTLSYVPENSSTDICTRFRNTNVWAFELANAGGVIDDNGSPTRTIRLGSGVPSDPRINVDGDTVSIMGKTSEGFVFDVELPADPPPPMSRVYWRQRF